MNLNYHPLYCNIYILNYALNIVREQNKCLYYRLNVLQILAMNYTLLTM